VHKNSRDGGKWIAGLQKTLKLGLSGHNALLG
jgi:hypothetical protein